MTSATQDAPTIIDTTGEEVPPSLPARPPVSAPATPPSAVRPEVVPFASTLRHLAPDAPFLRETG